MEDTQPPNPEHGEPEHRPILAVSEKPLGPRLAKFALWSPFIGLFVHFAVSFIVLHTAGGSDYGVIFGATASALAFAGGIGLGIVALRRCKLDGRKGIVGRAAVGLTLNFILLASVIVLGISVLRIHAETERMLARSRGNGLSRVEHDEQQRALDQSTKALQGIISARTTAYLAAAEKMNNPSALDMAAVNDKQDLLTRKEAVLEFMAAGRELLDCTLNSSNYLKKEMDDRRVPAGLQRIALRTFIKEFPAHMLEGAAAIRKADAARGQSMLDVLTFLEDNWGQWEYKPQKKLLEFRTTKMTKDYQSLCKRIDAAAEEMARLQSEFNRSNAPPNVGRK